MVRRLHDRIQLKLPRFFEARATDGLALLTLVASGLVLLLGKLTDAALGGGFIPARFDGVALPADHFFAVPAWMTPLTATLVHGGVMHLVLNLVMLVYCGRLAERAVGTRGVLVLYGVGAYAAALGQWLIEPGSVFPMIGASGAISAVVGAYALLYGKPRAKAIGPISANAAHVIWLAAAWIGIQLLVGAAGMGGGSIAIGAHIGGFIAGLALARPLLLWRYREA